MREAPRWFVEELGRIDERLRCRWDGRKFVVEQWVPRLGYHWHVLDVADDQGMALEPGEWVLVYLRQQDMWRRRGGFKAYIHEIEARNKRLHEQRQRHASDERVVAMVEKFTHTGRFADGTRLVG